jgi:hypothetical protein
MPYLTPTLGTLLPPLDPLTLLRVDNFTLGLHVPRRGVNNPASARVFLLFAEQYNLLIPT